MSSAVIVVASVALCLFALPRCSASSPHETRDQRCNYCKALEDVVLASNDVLPSFAAIEAACLKFVDEKQRCRRVLSDSRHMWTTGDGAVGNRVFKTCRHLCMPSFVEMPSTYPSYDCYRIVRKTLSELKWSTWKFKIREAMMKMCKDITIDDRQQECYEDVTAELDRRPFELWRAGMKEKEVCETYSACSRQKRPKERRTEKGEREPCELTTETTVARPCLTGEKTLQYPTHDTDPCYTTTSAIPYIAPWWGIYDKSNSTSVKHKCSKMESIPSTVHEVTEPSKKLVEQTKTGLPWLKDVPGIKLRPMHTMQPEKPPIVAGGDPKGRSPIKLWWPAPPPTLPPPPPPKKPHKTMVSFQPPSVKLKKAAPPATSEHVPEGTVVESDLEGFRGNINSNENVNIMDWMEFNDRLSTDTEASVGTSKKQYTRKMKI